MLPRINRQRTGLNKSHLLDRKQSAYTEDSRKRAERREEAAREKGLTITKVDSDEERWVIRSAKTGQLIIEFWNKDGKYMTRDGVIRQCQRDVFVAIDIAATLKEQVESAMRSRRSRRPDQ